MTSGVAADRDIETVRTLDLANEQRVIELLSPDCVYHEDPHWLDGREFRGRDEIAAILADYRDVWGTQAQEIERVERVGAAIVASIRQRGVTPRGEMPFEQVWTYVFRMTDGQVDEMWAFADSEEGRKKAAEIR
jgi:ketosteroid isomerase-like protein